MSFSNLLKGIWSFILGSLRIILFFGCLFYLLIAVGLGLISLTSVPKFEFETRITEYIQIFAIFVALVAGCYGTFYKHHPSIKLFALIMSLLSMWMVIDVKFNDNSEKMLNDMIEKFKSDMKDYSWWLPNKGSETATSKWDLLQKLSCCGIDGPSDWDKYRPSSIQKDRLPFTCCLGSRDSYCTSDSIFLETTGCRMRLKGIQTVAIYSTYLLVFYQLILCMMAYVITHWNIDRSVNLPSSSSQPQAPREYQRFEGSVYIRQPPTNQNYNEAGLPTPAPLYPNVYNVEKKSPIPPPGYSY